MNAGWQNSSPRHQPLPTSSASTCPGPAQTAARRPWRRLLSPTRTGTTTTTPDQPGPFEATEERWGVSNATSRTNGLNWTSSAIDWSQFTHGGRPFRERRTLGRPCFTGDQPPTRPGNDNDIRNATGGYGMWIGRPIITGGEGFTTTGWNFLLSVAGNPTSRRSNPDIQVFNGAVHGTQNASKNIVKIEPEDLPVSGDRHEFLIVHFRQRVTMYIDGLEAMPPGR